MWRQSSSRRQAKPSRKPPAKPRSTPPPRRRDRHLPPAVLLTALCILASAPGSSQGHPNHSIGLTPDGSYDSGGIDNISLFSGAATLSIPIGPRYPVSSTLSYGLTAVYNSNVWEYKSVPYQGQTYTEAYPSRQQNLGLGWMITLGELWHPGYVYNQTDDWIYVDSSGAAHKFYSELMQGTSDGSASHHYTRDGSFIRLRQIDNWNATIETPDGLIRKFVKPGSGSRFRLTRIEDRFGNWVQIDYNADDNETLWTITDQHSRTHYVVLEERPWLGLTISAIDFQGRGGQRLLWTFNHWVQNRNRSCKHTHPAVPARIAVPLLVSINRPDGSSFKMLETDGQPAYNDLCPGGMYDFPGTISRVELPTLGTIAYEYQRYDFPLGPLDVYTAGTGVHKRTLRDRNGALIGQRVYKTFRDIQNWEMVTSVLEPTGECTRHWFYANPSPDHPSQTGWEYGLPFTTRFTSGGRYLSSQIFPSHNGNGCTGSPLRTSYLTFAHDPLPSLGNPADPSRWYNTNRRLAGTRTVFNDDGNRWIDVALTSYDGIGHYRTATTTGNVGPGAPHTRAVTTNFNPGRPAVAPWPTSTPWVIGRFNYIHANEPGASGSTTARTEFTFNSNTGVLACQRVLWSGTSTRDGRDLVTQYLRNGQGNVTQVRTRGGDLQTIPTNALCAGTSGTGAGANITYAAGAARTVRPVGRDGATLGYLTYDATIDPSTGWVTATRDPSGLQTLYTHDTLGRVTEVTPAEGPKTVTAYTNATSSTAARVRTTVTGAGQTLSDVEVTLDGLGRGISRRSRTPDHGWVSVSTTYDAAGRVLSQTLPNDPAKSVQYLNYDAFGRPGIIRPPEGSSNDVLLSYTGVRGTERQVRIRTEAGQIYQTWRQDYDTLGRLRIVVEPGAGSGQETGETLRAGYGYDVAGRLTVAQTIEGLSDTRQTRTFTYDNRGYLRSESHPELGGVVFYTGYDALGNFSRIVGVGRDLGYVRDVFGRLTEVQDRVNQSRPVLRYTYDTAPGRGQGKLATAVRDNRITLPGDSESTNVEVTESYDYEGTAGALSSRRTAIGGVAFTEAYAYDAAGRLTGITYPTCAIGQCGSVPNRTVSHGYNLGHLRTIGGFAGPLTYHPDGSWSTIPRANGVTDHREVHPSNPSRTRRLYTTDAWWNYNSGLMSYDGAGNLTGMHTYGFFYDAVGRLKRAVGSTPVSWRDWHYEYDAFGNLKTHTRVFPDGSQQTRTFQVSMATNRLSSATYDLAGNMTSWGGGSYGYDELGNLQRVGTNTVHAYSPSGERVVTYHKVDPSAPTWQTYTLRSAGGKVLREAVMRNEPDAKRQQLDWIRDYVWRGDQLLATVVPAQGGGEQKLHYTLDHLGSPALVTRDNGSYVARYDYAPFGEDMSPTLPDDHATFPMRFTGHERDFHNAGTLDDLDHMHARSYTPHIGRFLQVDPVLGRRGSPQSWNRYAYGANNPVNFFDPDGQAPIPSYLRNYLRRDLASVERAAWWLQDNTSVTANFALGNGIGVRGSVDLVGPTPGKISVMPALTAPGTRTASVTANVGQMPPDAVVDVVFSAGRVVGVRVGVSQRIDGRYTWRVGMGLGVGIGATAAFPSLGVVSDDTVTEPQWQRVSTEDSLGNKTDTGWRRISSSEGGLPGLPDPLVYTVKEVNSIISFETWIDDSRGFWESIHGREFWGGAPGGGGGFCDASCATPYY